jgi:hypothetical protein
MVENAEARTRAIVEIWTILKVEKWSLKMENGRCFGSEIGIGSRKEVVVVAVVVEDDDRMKFSNQRNDGIYIQFWFPREPIDKLQESSGWTIHNRTLTLNPQRIDSTRKVEIVNH